MAKALVAEGASAPAVHLATVAAGRTLSLNGVKHGPGSVVSLTVDEHAHLLRHGFLHDPRIAEIPTANHVGVVNGMVTTL